jgi:chromosome segregation ATPase
MFKSEDTASILSSQHFEAIQNDLICAAPDRSSDKGSELASLREFNSQLLERIGEFRKHNLALSSSESALRASLVGQEKRCADLERKMAKLSDEKWEKSLELEALSKVEIGQRDEIENIRREFQHSNEESEKRHLQQTENVMAENAELRARIDNLISENSRLAEGLAGLERLNSEQTARIDEADQLLGDLEEALETAKRELQASKDAGVRALSAAHEQQAQLGGKLQVLTIRENQLINAFDNLRAEYSSMDACYKEASTTVVRLRGELEVQTRHLLDSQRDVEALSTERTRLQQLLEVKENRDENERLKLQTTREQLDFLDRHLRQVSEALKRDKAEVLRLSKQIAEELQSSRQHPFREYLDAAEVEFTHLQTQLNTMSAMSPNRLKLETRLAQATEHRDLLKSAIVNSERHLDERIQLVQTVIGNASV